MFQKTPLLLLTLITLQPTLQAQEAVDAIDLVPRSGTLHRGDGQPPIVGDVAINDGGIVAVGKLETTPVKHVIDCTGLIVCPCFIDLTQPTVIARS